MGEFSLVQPRQDGGEFGAGQGGGVEEGGEEGLGPFDPVGVVSGLVGPGGGGQGMGSVDGPVPVLAVDDRRPGERLVLPDGEVEDGGDWLVQDEWS
jgi:hypothetical protein